jgi:hypothetical protein
MLVDLQTAQRMRGEAAAAHIQASLHRHLGLAGWLATGMRLAGGGQSRV